MKIELTFLRSKVARRVFVQFVLAALMPVAVTTLLVIRHSQDNLAVQSDTLLRASSKALGQSIYERLLFVDRASEDIVARLQLSKTIVNEIGQFDNAYLRNVAILTEPGIITRAFGLAIQFPGSKSDEEHLASGGAILARSWISDQRPRLFIARLLDATKPQRGMFYAEVNLDYLWGDPESIPYVRDFCVLDAQGKVWYCSTDGAEMVAEQVSVDDARLGNGHFVANYDDKAFFAMISEIFLAPQFNSASWRVLGIRSQADALAQIATFNSILVPVILLSILLVSFLSFTQIRKILVPLDKLIRGTRRIANGKFDSAVTVASGDEFEELALSMNGMARSLKTQFETMRALSEVDRLILSRAGIETVLETVLASMRKACIFDVASVTIFDDDSDTAARVFTIDRDQKVSIERILLDEKQREILPKEKALVIDSKNATDDFLSPLVDMGARSLFVLPITLNQRLSAIISLGFRNTRVPSKRKLAQVNDFADRVAVAMRVAEREEQLYRQAHYDSLTALPNRQLFKDRLQQSIAHAHRENRKGALLFLDLDRFKIVNDSQGHSVGDDLLRQVAIRLQAYAREADTVARLGGDEFTVILSNVSGPRAVSRVAKELIELLSKPFELNDRQQHVSASIGVTVYPDDGITVEDLLKNADTAMYRAKADGRGRHTFFTEQMNIDAVNRHRTESDLYVALAQDQFFLEYQPQVELSSNRIIGAEALIRWRHPSRGIISPVDFIPIAEDTGHIASIGRWVLQTACDQYKSWQSQKVAPERVAVNVSPIQIAQPEYVATVRQVLADSAISPSCLELEITENLLLDNADKTLEKLKTLHAMGIRIAIDDFGTGYSSMGYLNRLSFDVLKIDRSFVSGIGTSEESAAVVNAITAVALSLRKEVVAEGVETLEQLKFLGQTNCQCGQGKFFAMPLPARQFASFMRNWQGKKAS